MEFVTAAVVVVVIAFAVFVIRGYVKRLSQGCCGGGDTRKVARVKVADRNKDNYPHLTQLRVDGMVCSGCAARIENALNVLDGVWAQAEPGTGLVSVRMKQPVSEQLLRDTVNGIGPYTVMEVAVKQ